MKIIADEIVTLDKARDYFAKHVNIKFELDQMNPKDVDDFNTLAQKYHGSCGLMFHISRNGGKDQRIFAHNIRVSSGREFIKNSEMFMAKITFGCLIDRRYTTGNIRKRND